MEQALQVLRQTSLVADCIHTIVTLAVDLGWEFPKLISLCTQVLKEIELLLILGRMEFCTVPEVSNLAFRIGNQQT